jgi:ribosomal protein S21
MIQVEVWNGDIETAIKHFKKRVINSGLLKELKRNSFALSKGKRRKEKDQFSLRRLKRSERRKGNDGRGK